MSNEKHIWQPCEIPFRLRPEFDVMHVCKNCGMEKYTDEKNKISVYSRSDLVANDLNDYSPYCFNMEAENDKQID